MGVVRLLTQTLLGRIVVGLVAVGVVAGVVIAPRLSTGAPATPVRTQAVVRGNVIQTIAVSGSVNAAAQVRASFKASGRLSEILVKVGDTVAAGQPLARIDPTDLATAVKRAEANVLSAQAKYDSTVEGVSAEDLALAKNALESAQRSYEQTQRTGASDVSAAKEDLARATADLADARTTFSSLVAAIRSDIATYQDAIAPARSRLDDALASTEFVLPSDDTDDARDSLNSADVSLENAATYVTTVLTPAFDAYASSAAALDAAVRAFDAAVSAGASSIDTIAKYQETALAYDLAATRLTSAIDSPGGQVTAALSSVNSALSDLNSLGTQERYVLDQARADIVALQTALTDEQHLATAMKTRITQAGSAVTTISGSVSGTVTQAREAYDSAVTKAADSLDSQASALRSAQITFQKSTASPKATDIALARASLQLAQIELEKAQSDLGNATLVAPVAGKVVSVASQVGETPASPFIVVADMSSLQLHGTVGESDIASLQLGQTASISIEAVGSATRLTGKVTLLDPVATISQGVPVYGVDVTLDRPAEAIRPGMSGTATVVVASKRDVLTVPNSAIRTSAGVRSVQVQRNGQIEDAKVTFGISNGTVTEVTGGLVEGDLVVLRTTRTTITTTTQRTGTGGFVGPGGGPVIVNR